MQDAEWEEGKRADSRTPQPIPQTAANTMLAQVSRAETEIQKATLHHRRVLRAGKQGTFLHSHAVVLREGVRMAQVGFPHTQNMQCHSPGTQPHYHPLYQGWAHLFHCLLSIYRTLGPT